MRPMRFSHAATGGDRMFKIVKRGKFFQLQAPGGGPVEVKLFGCVVVAPTYGSGGKQYARFDLTQALGREHLTSVAEFIKQAAAPRFSPLRFGFKSVVVKMGGAKWETAEAATFEFPLEPGQRVDLVVGPGAFGDFGWCIVVKRIKRSDPSHAASSRSGTP